MLSIISFLSIYEYDSLSALFFLKSYMPPGFRRIFSKLNISRIKYFQSKLSPYLYLVLDVGNQCAVLFAISTKNSIVGTSVNTPTVVASAAGESIPNNAIATATDSSKKFDAPIIPAGAAMS